MAGPITWQNIAAPSIAEASRGLALAQQGINAGFDSFNNVIKQQTDAENANWEQVKKNNTEAFLAKLYQAQGAEGFKALQSSGELDRMLAANGAQIDAAAARSAMDGRLGVLQQRDVAGIQYKNTMLDDAQAGDVRRIGMLTLTDPEAAKAELAAKPELRAAVQLAQGIDSRQQVLKDRVWNEQKQQWETAAEAQRQLVRPLEVKKLEEDLKNSPLDRAYKQSQIALNQAHARAYDAEQATKVAGKEAEATKAALAAALKDNLYRDGPLTPSSIESLAELAKKNDVGGKGDDAGDKRAKLMERITDLANKGVTRTVTGPDGKPVTVNVPIPLSVARAALLSSTNTTLSWNGGYADDFETRLQKLLPGVVAQGSSAVDPLVENFQGYSALTRLGAGATPTKKR